MAWDALARLRSLCPLVSLASRAKKNELRLESEKLSQSAVLQRALTHEVQVTTLEHRSVLLGARVPRIISRKEQHLPEILHKRRLIYLMYDPKLPNLNQHGLHPSENHELGGSSRALQLRGERNQKVITVDSAHFLKKATRVASTLRGSAHCDSHPLSILRTKLVYPEKEGAVHLHTLKIRAALPSEKVAFEPVSRERQQRVEFEPLGRSPRYVG